MTLPDAYRGREQSLLKHLVLREYATRWGYKLASLAKKRAVRLCYVDAFAGPWESAAENLADTSIAISLKVLEEIGEAWSKDSINLQIEAAFVEENASRFAELDKFLRQRSGRVKTVAYHGEFNKLVSELESWLGNDAALIFVDPKGWKDIGMRFIAPLVAPRPPRDVIVNVMYEHLNRFKDDPRPFLRAQMRELFGLGDAALPEGLGEEELFDLYRAKLKEVCGLTYAADIAVPHPKAARTKFRLVVGGKNPAVLDVARDVEKRIVGAEAAALDEEKALQKDREKGQISLPMPIAPAEHGARYDAFHRDGLRAAPTTFVKLLGAEPTKFSDLWPRLLEEHHITRTDAGRVAWELFKSGSIVITNPRANERTAKDHHLLVRAHTK